MNYIGKRHILVTLLGILFLLSACGSSSRVSGHYMGQPYEADIADVIINGSFYTVNPNWADAYAMTPQSLQITLVVNSYWGSFPDTIFFGISNAEMIIPGEYYTIGDPGIVGKMTINGNPETPTGYISFSKISLYYSRNVCGKFSLLLADGAAGEFNGNFCGTVQTGVSDQIY